ncbi:MAG: hypothetical protein AB7I79_02430 [Rhizobiaceae bacterium]
MRLTLAAAILAVLASDAAASGGLSCSVEEGPVKLEIESGITRGMGGPLFNFSASAEFDAPGIDDDLHKIRFEREHVPQYWLDGEVLQLVLYRERIEGEHGYVQVTVLTRTVDEGTYEGTFALEAFDMAGDTTGQGKEFKAEGKIGCFVE